MEIIGKIILALPEVSGTSQKGNMWKKREYVLETQENYPKKIFFDFFGDRADQYPLEVGQVVRLYFDIESREYNGRWYTSIRGWKTEDPALAPAQAAPVQPAAAPYGAPAQPAYTQPAAFPGAPANYGQPAVGAVPPPPVPGPDASDDLPF